MNRHASPHRLEKEMNNTIELTWLAWENIKENEFYSLELTITTSSNF